MANTTINEQAFRAAIGGVAQAVPVARPVPARPVPVQRLREHADAAAHAAHLWRGRHNALRDDLVRLLDRLEADPLAYSVRARLLDPIRAVLRHHGGPNNHGRMVFAPAVVRRPITPQQLVVLGYMAEGYSAENTARAMGVRLNTVKTHIRKLFESLGVHTGAHAVHVAHQLGLLNGPRAASTTATEGHTGGVLA